MSNPEFDTVIVTTSMEDPDNCDSSIFPTDGDRNPLTAEQSVTFKIRRTHAKLNEASNTTLTAANSILDGLDRLTVLLDELDAHAALAEFKDIRGEDIRNALRDELMAIMDIMQFQDIASQQLATASSTLSQAEERLASASRAANGEKCGDENTHAASNADGGSLPSVFDSNATMENRAERQAAVDLQTLASRSDAP